MRKEIKLPIIIVSLMDDVTHTVILARTVKGWREARKLGAKILRLEPDEKTCIRIHDQRDASKYDFITRASLQKTAIALSRIKDGGNKNGKRKGIKYSKNGDC